MSAPASTLIVIRMRLSGKSVVQSRVLGDVNVEGWTPLMPLTKAALLLLLPRCWMGMTIVGI